MATCEVSVGYVALGKIEQDYEIKCTVVDDRYAVNKQLERASDGTIDYAKGAWNITHQPTGWAVISDLPSQKVATAIAKRLTELGITTSSRDPQEANELLAHRGLREFKVWLASVSGLGSAELVAAVNRWERGKAPKTERRAAKGTRAAGKKKAAKKKAAKKKPAKKKAAKKKAAKKKASKKKGAKKRASKKKSDEGLSLAELALRRRGLR